MSTRLVISSLSLGATAALGFGATIAVGFGAGIAMGFGAGMTVSAGLQNARGLSDTVLEKLGYDWVDVLYLFWDPEKEFRESMKAAAEAEAAAAAAAAAAAVVAAAPARPEPAIAAASPRVAKKTTRRKATAAGVAADASVPSVAAGRQAVIHPHPLPSMFRRLSAARAAQAKTAA
ncbi:hypothetical protein DB346_20005 [Verrucomicrobia bacterium LW23]|nr:hypothetical protein DB346_20005 [Verrucomicrobia bacterium LW23]